MLYIANKITWSLSLLLSLSLALLSPDVDFFHFWDDVSLGKPNNMFSFVLLLLSTKTLSTGCLPANVRKIFLETSTGSTTGLSDFETSDRGHLSGFFVIMKHCGVNRHASYRSHSLRASTYFILVTTSIISNPVLLRIVPTTDTNPCVEIFGGEEEPTFGIEGDPADNKITVKWSDYLQIRMR